MRLISYDHQGHAAIGVVKSADANEFIALNATGSSFPGDMTELLASPGGLAAVKAAVANAPAHAVKPLAGIKYLPVVPRPPKIVCLGLNYADHAKEGGHEKPEYPSFFMRGATSQVAHNQPIVRPKASTKLDYEAELAVVIGKLLLIDLSHIGTVPRIVSFLGVGTLMLVVGYFSPLPPKQAAT